MKVASRDRASAHTRPCSLLGLGFSLVSILVLSFTATSPSIRQAPHLQHKLVFQTSSPLPPSPVGPPSPLPEASTLRSGATDAWLCASQQASGLLLPSYPCEASAVKQVLHLLRWPIFYLVLRPVALGDWLWVGWLLAHIFNAIERAALLLASFVAQLDAQCDPRVTSSPFAGEHRSDTSATTVIYCNSVSGKPHGDGTKIAGSGGHTSTGSQHAAGPTRRRSKKPQSPRGRASAAATAAAPKKLAANPVSTARTLLRAWSRLRGLLLLLASPCTYGLASLLHLSVWVGVHGTRVDAAQRRRWLLLAERNNGMSAARHPHLVALLGILSAECLPVPHSLLVRACFASLASCVAHSLTVSLLQLPPWDATVPPTSSAPVPTLAIRVVLRDLPAYIVSYMTPALYLCLRRHVPMRGTRPGWAGAQRAPTAGANLHTFCKRMLRGMQSVGIGWFRASRSAAGRNGHEGSAGAAAGGALTPGRGSTGTGSGAGWSLQPPAGERGHGAELASSDGALSSPHASPPYSPAAATGTAGPGTPAMSQPMQLRRWSFSSPGFGRSFRPSTPARPAWLCAFGDDAPEAGHPAPGGLGAAQTAHTSIAGTSQATGTAAAASTAAAMAAALLSPPRLSPPHIAAATGDRGPETAVPGHAAVGGAATVGPLYRSRLPGSALVMSCKFKTPPGMAYAPASAAFRRVVANLCVSEAAAARAAAAVTGEAAAPCGGNAGPAGSALSVQCLTVPGCVQLVLVVQGADEMRAYQGTRAMEEQAGSGCGAGSDAAAVAASLPVLDRLPSWLQPRVLWAAVARAAEGLAMRPLTVPRVQCVTRPAQLQGIVKGQQQQATEGDTSIQRAGASETGAWTRPPALLYAEPVTLSTTTPATQRSGTGPGRMPASRRTTGLGAAQQHGAQDQEEGAGEGAKPTAPADAVVELFLPPQLLQCVPGQQDVLAGARGLPAEGGATHGSIQEESERWRLVVLATAALGERQGAQLPHLQLYPAAASHAEAVLPDHSSRRGAVPAAHWTVPTAPAGGGLAARAAAAGMPPHGPSAPLRLHLPASLLRSLGPMATVAAAAKPPTRFPAAQGLPYEQAPAAPARAAATLCPTASASGSPAPPDTHSYQGGSDAEPLPRCGTGCGATGALLHLHVLAVPRDCPAAAALAPEPLGQQGTYQCKVPRLGCSGAPAPHPTPLFHVGRGSPEPDGGSSGHVAACCIPRATLRASDGSHGGGAGALDRGSAGAAMVVETAAASAAVGEPTAPCQSLPQAVWLGTAPLLLAPPRPAGELAALWERMKREVERQGEGRKGAAGAGAAAEAGCEQDTTACVYGPGRFLASSGVAMQHHMRPLLRDLAAAVGQQGQGQGQGAEDAAHLRAFLQSQGMSGCVEWMDEAAGTACGGEGVESGSVTADTVFITPLAISEYICVRGSIDITADSSSAGGGSNTAAG